MLSNLYRNQDAISSDQTSLIEFGAHPYVFQHMSQTFVMKTKAFNWRLQCSSIHSTSENFVTPRTCQWDGNVILTSLTLKMEGSNSLASQSSFSASVSLAAWTLMSFSSRVSSNLVEVWTFLETFIHKMSRSICPSERFGQTSLWVNNKKTIIKGLT